MDTRKEDTGVRTAPEEPAMPAPGELGPGPSAVPSEPLHGPVDVAEDSLEGLQSAFWALSVEEVDTHPVKSGVQPWSSKDLQVLRICRSQRLDMGPKRVMWVRRYQGQCRALRPLEHQGCRLRNHNKDEPLCSGYTLLLQRHLQEQHA